MTKQQALILGETHTFSPRAIDELHYVWSRDNNDSNLGGTNLNAGSLGFGGIPYQPGLLGGIPNISFSDLSVGIGANQWTPSISETRDQQISNALTLLRCSHSFKIGGAFNHYGWLQYLSQEPVGVYSFQGSQTNSAVPLPAAAAQQNTAASIGSGFAQFLFGISDFNGLSTSILSDNSRNTGSLYALAYPVAHSTRSLHNPHFRDRGK